MWIINGVINAVGANYIGEANYVVVYFYDRVISDGGVVEAQACSLANASYIYLIP